MPTWASPDHWVEQSINGRVWAIVDQCECGSKRIDLVLNPAGTPLLCSCSACRKVQPAIEIVREITWKGEWVPVGQVVKVNGQPIPGILEIGVDPAREGADCTVEDRRLFDEADRSW